jgi:hypothetical protein
MAPAVLHRHSRTRNPIENTNKEVYQHSYTAAWFLVGMDDPARWLVLLLIVAAVSGQEVTTEGIPSGFGSAVASSGEL